MIHPLILARTGRVRRLRWLAAAVVLMAAACSLGPRYRRPDIPAPDAWRASDQQAGAPASVTATAAGVAPASPTLKTDPSAAPAGSLAIPALAAPAWPSSEWWRGFHSPQLDDLMAEAQHANDDIAAAIARVGEADAQARIAGAALLPSLSVSADATRERTRSSTSPTSSPLNYNLFTAEAGASYEIDFWGRYRALHNAARMAAVASRYDRATVELTVMASVASTYFQALGLRDRLEVAQNNLASAQTILDGLRLEKSVGTLTALDVAQQESTVAALQAAVPPLKEQLLQTLDALAILIGRQPAVLGLTAGTLAEVAEPAVSPGLPSELLTRRPDVASAEAQLIAANANIAAARAAFFPNIALTASGGYASTALSNLFNPVSRVFALAGGVTQPIFQGGALSGQYAYTKARYQELLADYHKVVISAFGNVEDALAAVQQTADQQRRQQEAVDKARHAYELSQDQLHAGVVNILTVLNTENALFTAEDNLVQVRFSHLRALIALFNALGGGWQRT